MKIKLRVAKTFATVIGFMSFFILLLFYSCNEESFFYQGDELYGNNELNLASSHEKKVMIAASDWRQQLDCVLSDTIEVLNKNGISLLSYELVDSIKSEDDLNSAKLNIQSENSYVPSYAGSLDRIVPITIKEAKIRSSIKQQFSEAMLKSYLDKNVKTGLKELKLNWHYENKYFSTICLVSDEKGIVYDNLISNIVILKQCIKQSNNTTYLPVRLKSATVEPGNGQTR